MKDIDGVEEALRALAPYRKDIEADFARHNEQFLKLHRINHDPIGRVLKVHLIIENFMDLFLTAHYEIDNIASVGLSFHQKAQLLPNQKSSAAFVRPGILQLNAIRNKFGHRLNYQIDRHEVSAIRQALEVTRKGANFSNPIEEIEAFAPVACAFLSIPPQHIKELFAKAFSNIKSYTPEE